MERRHHVNYRKDNKPSFNYFKKTLLIAIKYVIILVIIKLFFLKSNVTIAKTKLVLRLAMMILMSKFHHRSRYALAHLF